LDTVVICTQDLKSAKPTPNPRQKKTENLALGPGVVVIFAVAGGEDGQPDDESTGDERQDAGRHLEAPRIPEPVVVGRSATNPEVLALETEGVVGEDHSS